MTVVSHGPSAPASPATSPPLQVTRVRRRQYSSARRHFRAGCRASVLRALTGARGYRNGWFSTVSEAAIACGSNVTYVAAAIVLIESENTTLVDQVLTGKVSLLAAAKEIGRLAELVTAYRKASAADRVQFARAIGPSTLFDNSLVPAL
jgi:hypothetical protein